MQCLARCRAESAVQARQIDSMLAHDGWAETASFASYHVQSKALGLLPWQEPPCDGDSEQPDPDATRLMEKMLAAGISKYHPDPLQALAEAKKKCSVET